MHCFRYQLRVYYNDNRSVEFDMVWLDAFLHLKNIPVDGSHDLSDGSYPPEMDDASSTTYNAIHFFQASPFRGRHPALYILGILPECSQPIA